jgi:hypothetical protein
MIIPSVIERTGVGYGDGSNGNTRQKLEEGRVIHLLNNS